MVRAIDYLTPWNASSAAMKQPIPFVPLFCTLSYLALLVAASAGDRSNVFQQCLSACQTRTCASEDSSSSLALALRLTRWSCADDCSYSCMHRLTDIALAQGRPVLQYYGKWPFWRFLGMQEPASVLFSLLNFWVHWRGFKAVLKSVPGSHPMKHFILLWSIVSMNAWICSAVFHTRGTYPNRLL